MFKFRLPGDNDNLFDSIYMTSIKHNKIIKTEHVAGETSDDEKEHFISEISNILNPFNNSIFTNWSDEIYISFSKKNDVNYYFYSKLIVKENVKNIYTLISKYLHSVVFKTIMAALESIEPSEFLEKYSKLQFHRVHNDVALEFNCENSSLINHLSEECEIYLMQKFFFVNFPPFYAPTIITHLAQSKRIFIVSSSFSFITSTILSIHSLFLPLDLGVNVIPILNTDKWRETMKNERHCIMGIPKSLYLRLVKYMRDSDVIFNIDEPYIFTRNDNHFERGLLPKFVEFSNAILALTKQYTPLYPGCYIHNQLAAFLVYLICSAYGISFNNNFAAMKTEWEKYKDKKESTIKNIISQFNPIKQIFTRGIEKLPKVFADYFTLNDISPVYIINLKTAQTMSN